jgi:hypothetical protein
MNMDRFKTLSGILKEDVDTKSLKKAFENAKRNYMKRSGKHDCGQKMFWLVQLSDDNSKYMSIAYTNSVSLSTIIIGSSHDINKTFWIEIFEKETEAFNFSKNKLSEFPLEE